MIGPGVVNWPAGDARTREMTAHHGEALLLKVLRDCLDNEDIGPSDNFFAMGGDSILALDVIAAMRDQGLRISMRDMLTRATVRELASSAIPLPEDEPAVATADPFASLDDRERQRLPAGVVAVQPASVLQLALIYLAEMASGPKPYTDFLGLRVIGALDEKALRAALRQTMERHRMLRSSFDLDSFAEAKQLIWAEVEEPLTVEREEDGQRAEELVRAWQDGLLADGIAWDQPPAFRCQVVASAGSFRLSVAVHHSIVDGWSFARLLVDLLTYYDAACGGSPAALPPVAEQAHHDFVALEQADAAAAEATRFWLDQAAGPPLLIDEGRQSPADPTARRFLPIPQARWRRLRQAADDFGVPIKSLLLAAHGWALGRLTGRATVVSGVVVSGRPEIQGADRLVGLFLNTLPIRLPEVTGPWAEMAAAARDAEASGMPYRRYPLAHLERALGRTPFDVSFNFTHFRIFEELTGLRGLHTDNWWAYDKASFPMQVGVLVDAPESGTGLAVSFDPGLLAANRIERYLALMDQAFDLAARGR